MDGLDAVPQPGSANAASYERYFASGHYDRRYPRPNPTVMRLIARHLPPGAHLVDYGCGSGRYLLALRERVAVAAGFDVCRAALARLRDAASARPARVPLHVLGPDPADLDRHVAEQGPADVVLCLFGVLSHVEGAEERRATLRRMARLLAPETGRLILSVPNRRRRFRAEQRASTLPGGEIRYERRLGGTTLPLSYRLYDSDSLSADLAGAGLALETVLAESLLPESSLATSAVLRGLDSVATRLLPAPLGYGLLALARPRAR